MRGGSGLGIVVRVMWWAGIAVAVVYAVRAAVPLVIPASQTSAIATTRAPAALVRRAEASPGVPAPATRSATWPSAATVSPGAVIDPAAVDRLVGPMMETGQFQALVVGVVTPRGRQTFGYGRFSSSDSRPPDGRTVFEIGSITKTFTVTLLADAVLRGRMRLEDPVAKYLPAEVKIPQWQGTKPITLLHLATHTATFPHNPGGITLYTNGGNPFANYTRDRFFAYVSGYALPYEPGTQCRYSNAGVALLAQALCYHERMEYEALVTQRICRPLGMNDTCITLSPDLCNRLAPGHSASGSPAYNWDLAAVEGAGALRSTTEDMLTFVAANAGLIDTPLAPAMRFTHEPRNRLEGWSDIGLVWFLRPKEGIVSHGGMTGGYTAWIAFSPAKRVGAVVLSNRAFGRSVEQIAVKLIELQPADPAKPATSVAAGVMRGEP